MEWLGALGSLVGLSPTLEPEEAQAVPPVLQNSSRSSLPVTDASTPPEAMEAGPAAPVPRKRSAPVTPAEQLANEKKEEGNGLYKAGEYSGAGTGVVRGTHCQAV